MEKKQTDMTSKEKAEELVGIYRKEILKGKYRINGFVIEELAEQCALIAVDEILKTLPQSEYLEDRLEMIENRELIYWKEVKQEIENL